MTGEKRNSYYAVYINEAQEYFVEENRVEINELADRISDAINGQSEATVVLRAHKDVPVQDIVVVIDAVNEINTATDQNHKVILATSQKRQ